MGELLAHKPLFPGRSEINQLDLIIDLLGTPNARIWPEIDTLPLLKEFTLKIQRKICIRNLIKVAKISKIGKNAKWIKFQKLAKFFQKMCCAYIYSKNNSLVNTFIFRGFRPEYSNFLFCCSIQ